jgi:hypothetical protein
MSSPGLSLRSGSTWRAVVTSCLAIAALTIGASTAAAQGNGRNSVPRSFSVVPITITSVAPDPATGQLIASGLAGTTAFTTPLTVTPRQVAGAACPILDLSLGPIDLTLLGLNVSTSRICLEVTAVPGGGLLGDLLCNVANLLSPTTPIAAVLDGLSATDRARVLNGLTSVINQVFNRLTANDANLAATCSVLSLSLGPLDLNLLGLRVQLNNCANGPVTVDITAIPGGGLLGDLLCGLNGLLSGGASPLSVAVQRLLFQIAQLIGALA